MTKEIKCKGCCVVFLAKSNSSKYHSEECKDAYLKNTYPHWKFKQYMNSANKRKLKFNLSFDDFMLFFKKPCSYCGAEIETVGIDRVDNRRGYEIDNVTSCCSICNMMKFIMDKDFFISHCNKVTDFNLTK